MNICFKKIFKDIKKILKIIPKRNRISNNPKDSKDAIWSSHFSSLTFVYSTLVYTLVNIHMRDMAKAGVTRTGSRGGRLER